MEAMSISNKLAFLFLVAFFTVPAIAYRRDGVLKETKLTLYIQDVMGGPNSADVPYAGIPGKVWNYDSFGTAFVVDNSITEGPDKNSREIARGQGIYVTSSLDGVNVHMLTSYVFTSGEYNGSTLEIQGRCDQYADVTELSVVGGTGKFRFAKGFVTVGPLSILNLPTEIISVSQSNVTVVHY